MPDDSTAKDQIEVYHFLLDPRLGGPLVVVQNVAARLEGVTTKVVTCGDGPGTDIKIAQIRKPFRAMYMLEFVVNIVLIFLKFFWIARRKKVIFHVHSATNNAPLIAAGLLRVPVVWHFHSAIDANTLVHPMVAAIFGLFRRVSHQSLMTIAHREVAASDATVTTWNVPKAQVLNSPIDGGYWSREAWGKEPTPLAHFQLVNVANLNHLKGHDVVMDALALLDDESVRIDFIGAELPTFKAYADELRNHANGSQMQILGQRGKEEVRDALGNASAFILPSRSEACPVSLCEAMAMGCLCIATRVGSVERFLENGRGIVCEPDDPQSLADGIARAMAMSDAERQTMQDAARAYVLEHCEDSVIAAEYKVLYESLLAEASAR